MLRIDSHKLKPLLGQFLHYRGIACQVIEILADEPALVLRDCSDHTLIQADQYGHAGEHLPVTFTVAVLNEHRDALNPELPVLAGYDLLA